MHLISQLTEKEDEFAVLLQFRLVHGDKDLLEPDSENKSMLLCGEIEEWLYMIPGGEMCEHSFYDDGVGYFLRCSVTALIQIWQRLGKFDYRYRSGAYPLYWYGPDGFHHVPDPRKVP